MSVKSENSPLGYQPKTSKNLIINILLECPLIAHRSQSQSRYLLRKWIEISDRTDRRQRAISRHKL